MSATIEPEPSDAEREAILAVLGDAGGTAPGRVGGDRLLEGVENDELDP